MPKTAKLFMNGRSQAVRLPREFRFEGKEVRIRKDPETGDIILSGQVQSWDGFIEKLKSVDFPPGFLSPEERNQDASNPDPFAGMDDA